MFSSVSAIKPDKEYAPVRSFEDSPDINQGELIGSSASFQALLRRVRIVAPTDSVVLIQGETGTGKELIAKAIHNQSSRRDALLLKMNCAAIPADLLESELFGHEKGAFTGAVAQTMGRFQLAHRGTLFLDEIGDLPVQLQPKLLRVLQEQEFERLGSGRPIKVDVRVVTATNQELLTLVQGGQFRADLYYRLNVFPICLPPLRDRSGDIPPWFGTSSASIRSDCSETSSTFPMR
ncbi:sigma 54-interacting transcriptional regulator [Tunturiibacter gelidiferens]